MWGAGSMEPSPPPPPPPPLHSLAASWRRPAHQWERRLSRPAPRPGPSPHSGKNKLGVALSIAKVHCPMLLYFNIAKMSPSVMKCSGSSCIRFYLLSWFRIRIQKLFRSGFVFKPILTRKPFEIKLCSTIIFFLISVDDFVSITRISINLLSEI
jgi:hypothetical protein